MQDIGKLNELTIERFTSSQLSTINGILKEWYEKDDKSILIYAICGQPDNIVKSGIELEYTYKTTGFRILFEKMKGIYKIKNIIPISIYEKN